MKKGSNGGKATAIINREKALLSYYDNPNYCKFCDSIIEVNDNEKVSQARKRIFCNRSCAASYNNSKRKVISESISVCPECGEYKNKDSNICIKCFNKSKEIISGLTKGYLFNKYKNWQSARSTIQSNARKILINSGKDMKCLECGYNKHVDCCHIKDVSEFSNESLISEINNISNLIWLCKNHHWEFDHGFLKIDHK